MCIVYALGIKSRINFVENLHYKVYWFLCVTRTISIISFVTVAVALSTLYKFLWNLFN